MTDPQRYASDYQRDLGSARQSLERFLQEDGRNVFDQKIWSDTTRATGPDVASLLDTAAPGLQWFERALIRYHRCRDVGLDGFDDFPIPPLSVVGEEIGGETIHTGGDPGEELRRLEGRWYDQQRSMNLDSLRTLSAALRAASAGTGAQPSANDITTDLNGVAQAVPEVWQGRAGAAAQDHLAGFHAHADQQAQYLRAVSAALTGLPEVLLQIVRDKANFVAGFDSPQCPVAAHAMRLDGAEDPVSTLITVAAESTTWGYLHGKQNTTAAQQLNLPSVGPGSDEGSQRIRDACKQWLTEHFRPAVQEAFKAFVHQCALADYYIRQAYKPVTDLLDSHEPAPFPTPAGQQPPAPGPSTPATSTPADSSTATSTPPPSSTAAPAPADSAPAASTPAPSSTAAPSDRAAPTPESPTSASSAPAAATPSSITPTSAPASPGPGMPDLGSALSEASRLSSLGQALGQPVTQGLGALSDDIQQGVGGILGQHNASQHDPADPGEGAAAPHARPSAEFDLAGKHLKIDAGAHGALEVSVSGADGTDKTYELKLDEHGMPIISTEDESPHDPEKHDPEKDETDPVRDDEHPDDRQRPDQKSDDAAQGTQDRQPVDHGRHHEPDQPVPENRAPNDRSPADRPHQPEDRQEPGTRSPQDTPGPAHQQSPPPGPVPAAGPRPEARDQRAAPPAPPTPPDSGAELAEAGPL